MEQVLPPTAPVLDIALAGLPEEPYVSKEELLVRADACTRSWRGAAEPSTRINLEQKLKSLAARLEKTLRACRQTADVQVLTPELEILESSRMLETAITGTESAAGMFAETPQVMVKSGETLPQGIALAEGYIAAVDGIWSPDSLATFVGRVQDRNPLLLREVMLLPQALKVAQLEFLLNRADAAFAAGPMPPIEESPFSASIHSLRRLNQYEWSKLLESLVAFDAVLRQDPAESFASMEEESRSAYRLRVAELAANADCSEVETAWEALKLAQEAAARPHSDARLAARESHIGYYLFAEGLELLQPRIGYHPPVQERLRSFVRSRNEDLYILGIFTLSLLLITAIVLPLVPHHDFIPVIGALLLALLPATQGAVDLVNSTVTTLFGAQALPKLDLSRGVPAEYATMVVVPTLLMRETQVRELIEELETRYLSNQDPNVHLCLLTDLPDTVTRPQGDDTDPLVRLAVREVEQLNAKYAEQRGGSFFLLHRQRVFNARQGVWMGWERKRGKLLDLNKLLLKRFDSFVVKTGPLELLDQVRYVITLDSDTQLPRGAAARMIGTMAHPLNRAIISPKLRIVTAGYGILQPRVGVSVGSASKSRLAALYSGDTGFDIYTRAVSDVYQDLFGEGIYTGKGIYEVEVLQEVLDRRFPPNALLSHDLIEGAYARAGLVTDIEVIDDYPSHYSAHTKRKHRWVRGDWQITQWLFNRVPNESGRKVENPISTVSRWKILDNLRRSLVEPVTFLLFVCGWFVLPGGPIYWTMAGMVLLMSPALVQLMYNLGRAILKASPEAALGAVQTFGASAGIVLLNLTFLPHHMMLSVDAIVRSLVRVLISGRNLLDWETAAQAEAGKKKRSSSLDWYLNLSPALAMLIAAVLVFRRPYAFVAAGPVLLLWALAPLTAQWLDSPPRKPEGPPEPKDRLFLQRIALLTWRYYADFGGAQNHWLIPDNVEEAGMVQVLKLSPTNLGMLFNARQAAVEFGFLTLPEFAEATLGTLRTYEGLQKERGHIFNWYDIETLKAIPPFTISAVDSGNLAASLYTLHTGTLELLKRPVLGSQEFTAVEEMLQGYSAEAARVTTGAAGVRVSIERLRRHQPNGKNVTGWVAEEGQRRRAALLEFAARYTPWLESRFEALLRAPVLGLAEEDLLPPLEDSAAFARTLAQRLTGQNATLRVGADDGALAEELGRLILEALPLLERLIGELKTVAAEAERHAELMEYGFLLVESRQLLSIGFDGSTGELHSACYDLLASEARIASFLAVAKGDIPQRAWFQLDRSHVIVRGRPALLSWTGTMFEYMMPALWMRTFPDTLMSRSMDAAVRIQREHVRGIPWGISESGFARTDELGRYGYQAWGIPALALKYGAEDGPVISPYSTFLALPLLRKEALANLRRMETMGWVGPYGFYEAADFTVKSAQANGSRSKGGGVLVRSWMAHHQGMSLLAITNLLYDNALQRWFHANPRVRAAELLLHEKPLSKDTLKELRKHTRDPAGDIEPAGAA